jgi:DNA-binding transcriptional LysR family regulator
MQRDKNLSTRIRNVDLNLLKIFDAVLSEKSISQAAQMLCVSQPAVSNALRRLRELYDDPLFFRTADGMMPTPKAQELSGPIQNALHEVDRTLLAEENFRPETSHRSFTVALTDYGEIFFLPKIVRRLAVEAPGVDIVCLPDSGATLTLQMKSGAVDLVWDWVRINDPEYHVEAIFDDPGYCLARRDHPQIDGQLSLELFLEVEHVALRPTRRHIPRIERALENQGLQRKVVAEVSHLVVMPRIVQRTNLIATMPERLARFYGQVMDLQVLPNPVYEDAVTVYQMWHSHCEDDEGHRWFRSLAKDVALSG